MGYPVEKILNAGVPFTDCVIVRLSSGEAACCRAVAMVRDINEAIARKDASDRYSEGCKAESKKLRSIHRRFVPARSFSIKNYLALLRQ